MAKFSAVFTRAQPSTTLGVMSIETPAAAPRRIYVREIKFGSDSITLGTSAWRFDLQRSVGPAAGVNVTPQALDTADVTFTSLVKKELTANGTFPANPAPMDATPLMQQATFRWIAPDRGEWVIPAAATNGLHLLTPVAGGNQSIAGTIYAEE